MNNDDYLAHHGVLGMKWGIRRYRNKDGSLTDAGKKRYEKRKLKPFGEMKDAALKKISPAYRRSHMSSEELASRISRLSQEKKLKDLERDVRDERVKLGEEVAKKVVKAAAFAAVTYGAGKLRIWFSDQTPESKKFAKFLQEQAENAHVDAADLIYDKDFLEKPQTKDLINRMKEHGELLKDTYSTTKENLKPQKKK